MQSQLNGLPKKHEVQELRGANFLGICRQAMADLSPATRLQRMEGMMPEVSSTTPPCNARFQDRKMSIHPPTRPTTRPPCRSAGTLRFSGWVP